jgi:hypothetical protein
VTPTLDDSLTLRYQTPRFLINRRLILVGGVFVITRRDAPRPVEGRGIPPNQLKQDFNVTPLVDVNVLETPASKQ